MNTKALVPNRDPRLPSDSLLDAMLREALGQPKAVVVTQDDEIGLGRPLPQPERFKWARTSCLLVL